MDPLAVQDMTQSFLLALAGRMVAASLYTSTYEIPVIPGRLNLSCFPRWYVVNYCLTPLLNRPWKAYQQKRTNPTGMLSDVSEDKIRSGKFNKFCSLFSMAYQIE